MSPLFYAQGDKINQEEQVKERRQGKEGNDAREREGGWEGGDRGNHTAGVPCSSRQRISSG